MVRLAIAHIRFVASPPPDVVFERAPLEMVLCQVKFDPVFALLAPAGVAGFQEGLRSVYPRAGRGDQASVSVRPGSIEATQQAPIFRFSDEAGDWTVSIAVDFVALETPRYTHFDDFADRLDRILDVLHRTVHPTDSVRVGLRKVNALQHPAVNAPADWVGLLNPSLLGSLTEPMISDVAQAMLVELSMRDDQEGTMVVRHGVVPDRANAYRIDIDYFTERPARIERGSELSTVVQEYSTSITEFFQWCLQQSLYEFLGPTARPERSSS